MTTQISVNLKPHQVSSAAITIDGVINPSRNITAEDEPYLRDYTLAAAVISWELQLYGTSAEYQVENITNICITGDTVWYQIEFNRAYPINVETFHTLRHEIEQQEKQLIRDESTPKPSLTPEVANSMEWRVVYAPDWDWDWYRAWAGGKYIGKYSTCEEAESAAQKYIATAEFWSSYREKELAGYKA